MRKVEQALGWADPFESFEVGRNLKSTFLKTPKGPYQGAAYTFRQIAATLNDETGLSNVGGSTTAQLICNSAVPVLFAMGFQLADVNQNSTVGQLFDQYRFEKVKVHFKSRNNAISVFNTASPNGAVPMAYLVVDRDDASAPSSLASLLEYDNCVTFTGGEDATVELVPSLTPAVYAGGAFSGYSVTPSNTGWLDIANSSVPVYGVKGGVSNLTTSTTSSWIWDIIVEVVISFRKTR